MMRQLYMRLLLIPVLMAIVGGCGPHRIPAATGPVDEPRASWRIRAGKLQNEHEICRSDLDQLCVIPASSDKEPMSVVVTIYLHPVGDAATTYQGASFATFMSTPRGIGYERQVDVEIKPGRRPTGITTAGIVVSNPGQYAFNMRLLGQVAAHTDPYEFMATIPVDVVASS